MGNRAVIAFNNTPHSVGVYLHWNGGPESVLAFLAAAKELHVRGDDEQYFLARFCQIIGNFFSGTSSLGIGTLSHLDCDNGDNGLYIIDSGLNIKERVYEPVAPETVASLSAKQRARYDGILKVVLAKNQQAFRSN
jgi:hypothetical protein